MCDKSSEEYLVREMTECVGISFDQLKKFPHEISGGQAQRISIARALSLNPRLLICDEPTTALDVTIQAQIMDILKELQEQLGISIVLITHNMGLVAQMASDVCVMYMGRIVEKGTREEIFLNPRHPYTQAL